MLLLLLSILFCIYSFIHSFIYLADGMTRVILEREMLLLLSLLLLCIYVFVCLFIYLFS